MKKTLLIVCMLVFAIALTGCLPNDGTYIINKAGFFWGVWHGWMAPLSLILGFFNHTTRIYEVSNTGWFYDLGFYMAVISGFGGFSLSRRKNKRDKD